MPRIARPVFAGVPHHITQREGVFFNAEDRAAYIEWLREYCLNHEVAALAYCLMLNK
jgi:putative transposase